MVLDAEIMSGSEKRSRILPPGRAGRRWGKAPHRTRRRLSLLLFAMTTGTIPLAGPASGQALAAEGDLYVVLRYAVDASTHGCWDEPEFRRGVAHRIGYDPFRDDAGIEVRVHVGGATHAVDGHVEWRKANGLLMGERRFVAKDGNCARLLTEMSFAVGLQIELLRPKPPVGPGALAATPAGGTAGSGSTGGTGVGTPSGTGTSASSTAGTASTTTGAPTPPAGPSTPTGRQETASGRRETEKSPEDGDGSSTDATQRSPMWIGLGPSLAWRLSPALTGDARLFLGIRHGNLSIEIAGEATYPSTDENWDGSGFRQSLIGGTLALCGHHDFLSACAMGRASQVRVTGVGVDHPRSPNGFAGQAGLRLAGSLPLGDVWFLAAHLDVLGLLTSCRIQLNQATVWEMPRLGVLGGIDLVVRFR